MKCPNCGHEWDVLVSESEGRVLGALLEIQHGLPVETQTIADYAQYSYVYTVQLLGKLEQRELVRRPFGERSGWMVAHGILHQEVA